MKNIINRIMESKRISIEDAMVLYDKADLLTLGQLANNIRKRIHPDPVVTYIIDRNINYTNICQSQCKFCAFYKQEGARGGYILTQEELFQKIRETIALGGHQIMIQGGLHPHLGMEYYEKILGDVKREFPNLWIHGFSPPEIIHISRLSKLSVHETIQRLQEAGLDSIPGGGAEILVDRVRQLVSPIKCSTSEWLDVMKKAHNLGMRTTATMMFGHLEIPQERWEHLEKLRTLQDETKGFTAFIPWPFQPKNTQIKVEENTGSGYLRMLAISRIFLDNFDNIQASWVTQGSKIAQIALFFGANDMGSTMIEENVVKAAEVTFRLSESEIRSMIEGAGYRACKRNMLYHIQD